MSHSAPSNPALRPTSRALVLTCALALVAQSLIGPAHAALHVALESWFVSADGHGLVDGASRASFACASHDDAGDRHDDESVRANDRGDTLPPLASGSCAVCLGLAGHARGAAATSPDAVAITAAPEPTFHSAAASPRRTPLVEPLDLSAGGPRAPPTTV